MVRIQNEDFQHDQVIEELRNRTNNIGAIVTFTGIVREFADAGNIQKIHLEHYPGMTEKVLEDLIVRAEGRWELLGTTIVHRTGDLPAGDNIVLVATASKHRRDAFEAAQYIMDFLKTEAPFWKKEFTAESEYWVEAKSSDQEASNRWE